MQQVFLPIDEGSFSTRLLDWIDYLRTQGLVRLTIGISAALLEKETLCRSIVLKLERFCRERDIRLTVERDQAAASQPEPDLIILEGGHGNDELAGPVLSLPQRQNPNPPLSNAPAAPGELILLYDGSPASRSAIEQFARLFPRFENVPATLVYFTNDPNAGFPDEWAMRIQGARLFRRFRVLKMQPRTKGFYEAWLGMMTSPWIVSGARRRDELVDPMHSAIAAELVQIRPMPAFAA
ncbi:MAG TPA: hypothetical protein VGR89_17095 [Puia sp.]|nr:hypothetical protein [Puia sp.]